MIHRSYHFHTGDDLNLIVCLIVYEHIYIYKQAYIYYLILCDYNVCVCVCGCVPVRSFIEDVDKIFHNYKHYRLNERINRLASESSFPQILSVVLFPKHPWNNAF